MQLMKWGLKPRSRKLIACMVALIMLLSIMGLGIPGTAQAKTDTSAPAESLVVNILNPDGTTTLVHDYSYAELASLEETEYYATIDSMPAAVGTKAKGVKINTLINDAKQYNSNIKWESGQRLLFYVTDSPYTYQPAFYTYDNLYGQNRYYYPELVETYDLENPAAVSLKNAVLVEPMLASSSYQARGAKDADLKSTDNPVAMDGNDSFRFCMGITETEASTPGVSTTNKFARWVYRVDVGPLNSPKLKADTTDNAIGQPIEITFTDNSAWREKITQIKVDENVLNSEQYAITAGKLTINSDVFTQAGDYTITVESPGYMNSTVKQTINGPPAHTVTFTVTDGTNAIQGANITIAEQTLTTDADGKATIDLEDGNFTYSVTAIGFITITDGSVTVNGAALAEAVTMTVKPAGLTDAEKVAVAKANLTLGDISAVIADLTLPGTQNEATVTWTSGNTNVITNDGKVTRPATGQPDASVTLTATITAGEASDTKDFIVTVKAEEAVGPKTPPALYADSINNNVGQAIAITFTDDATWCGAITGVTVDDIALTSGQYSVTAGNINLIADIFIAPGDYVIAVQATDYADACVTQNILGVPRPGAWDGSIDTSWYNTVGKGFEISTPAELAGLAAIVNGTADGIAQDEFEGKTAVLMSDIDLGGIQNRDGTWDPDSIEWTSIGGGDSQAYFKGIFDGNGHVVSNIYIEKQASDWQTYEGRNRGLFGQSRGIVKNLGVTGYVAANRSVGGVVGCNIGRIENCFNAATVIGTDSKGVGGITGANWCRPSIINCYNTGSVLTKYGTGLAGGMAGDNESLVSNCYNAGKISSTGSNGIGGIVGNIKNYADQPIIVRDCYYDSALNDKGVCFDPRNQPSNYTLENVEGKTAEEMKTAAFVALLNGENGTPFVQDTNNINNGYPILAWQATTSVRKTAPVLTPDTTNNNLGQSIDITFTDDADWRGVINRIIVNDTALTGAQYTVSAGNINIAASVFTAAGDYTITVPAANYHDTSVTQTIEAGTLSAPPELIADSTDNIWGQAVDITFTDDEAWRGAVYSITVNDSALTGGQYTLTAGNINIAAVVFTVPGDYEIVIQASGYNDAVIAQSMKAESPTLTADTTDNIIGTPIEITFTDDEAWRNVITAVNVDGSDLAADKYTIATGKITIAADVFKEVRDYEIIVRASNYLNTSLTQAIVLAAAPALTADITDNIIGNSIEITFTDDEAWRTAITAISMDGSDLATDKYTIAAGKITIAADVFTEVRDYEIIFRANNYLNISLTQAIVLPAAPTLTADTIDNIIGNPIEITFTEDETWRTAITAVKVDGSDLAADKYTIAAGKITIIADVFTVAKNYSITVWADGYDDATVTQSIVIEQTMMAGYIYTIAGNGTTGYLGDGGAAVYAQLNSPRYLTIDSNGNTYIAQYGNNCIRKVATNGIITTVAGNGSAGYAGDGGQATEAQFNKPMGVAVDNNGNLYIADYGNNCIRKVATNGIIATVAGNGSAGYAGDGGQATEAQLNKPYGVAVDSNGNIYIADYGNNRIRKVTADGIITTVAGNGSGGYAGDGGQATEAQLNQPRGIAVDNNDNIYIIDFGNYRIRKVAANGIITTVVGNGSAGYAGDGGQATEAQLNKPMGVAVDNNYNLYIAEYGNYRIRKVATDGIITTVAGNGSAGYAGDGGPAIIAQLSPSGVALDSCDNLYIADFSNERVRFIKAADSQTLTPPVLSADSTDNIIGNPIDITFTDNESWRNAITEVKIGETLLESNKYTKETGKITIDAGVFTTPKNYIVMVKSSGYLDAAVNQSIISFNLSDLEAGYIYTIAGNGTQGYSGDGGKAVYAQLTKPLKVALDNQGNYYIADQYGHRIRKVDTDGNISTIAGNGKAVYSGDGGPAISAQLNYPTDVTVDGAGNLYIADSSSIRIRKVDTDGNISTVAGNGSRGYSGDGGPAVSAQLKLPHGIAVDTKGNLYIADCDAHCIRKVDTDGNISTVAGNGTNGYSGDGGSATSAQLNVPYGVAVDLVGNIYIAEQQGHRIRKVDTDGNISTVAGNGTGGYSGDSGPAVNAKILAPWGVQVDGAGNIYIADTGNYCIRKVDASGTITTVAGNGKRGYSGDGGPTAGAQFTSPSGIAVNSAGDLYIADFGNYCMRFIKAAAAELLIPPTLTTDTTTIGNPIDITFTDDEAWRNAITEVKVGETVLESNQYTKAEGKITIAAGIFIEAGTYTIVIKATGYEDASVTQIINKDYVTTTLSIKIDNGSPITVTAEQINALNLSNEIRHFSHYKDGQMNYVTGLGAPLDAILSQYASLDSANIASMTVRGADPYYVTFADPQNELFNERYYYPAVGDRVEVDTIIATKASENMVSDSSQLDNVFTMRLMMGQTSSEERTISRMVKWVSEIDITTTTAINVPVTGITLNKTATTLVVNHSEQLTASVTPANATDQTITWTTDNGAVATVDNTGKVTAVGAGEAVITATTNDGSFMASCTVTVAVKPLYTLTPVEDDVYTIGTSDGSSTMTVNEGQAGFKTFAVSVEPVISHKGNETVIFTHWRGGTELQLNATVADFDVANTAQAGFNVQPGDVIKVYIVDRLTNDSNINPVVFQ